jgi:PAS domain-containing protein
MNADTPAREPRNSCISDPIRSTSSSNAKWPVQAVGIVMFNLERAIIGANEAFLRMVQYNREDLASGRVRWMRSFIG